VSVQLIINANSGFSWLFDAHVRGIQKEDRGEVYDVSKGAI
jgi:hypothetical protein